jgi:hypothetical protein
MSRRAATWLAWSVCAAALALLAFSLLLVFLGWSTPLPRGWGSWQGQAILAVGLIGVPILGGLVASRRPGNPYGWLWLGFGLAFSLLSFAQVYAAYSLVVQPGSLPAPQIVGTLVAGIGWMMSTALFPFLLLLFPTGRLPSHRWKIVAWAIVTAAATALILLPVMPYEDNFMPGENPIGVEGTFGTAITYLGFSAVVIILVGIAASALSLVLRYRLAGGVERQQLKWFAYAAAFLVVMWAISFFYEPPGAWDTLAEMVPIVGLYVAVGIAILKYRLYDIDLLINRTLVYGSLTATLVLIYLGGVATVQATFRLFIGQEHQSQLAVVVSTLVIAALFMPLRRRIQAFIDRRFYRRKYDSRKTLQAFSATLRDETDLEALNGELVGVVRETMQPTHVSVWLRPDSASKNDQQAH